MRQPPLLFFLLLFSFCILLKVMIDRFTGLWQFGRLYSQDTLYDFLREPYQLPEEGSEPGGLLKEARKAFFTFDFNSVSSMEHRAGDLLESHPEFWGLLGHSHIWQTQGETPFSLNPSAWERGLSYFEKGLSMFPESRLLQFDVKRARGILDSLRPAVSGSGLDWPDTYLSLYLEFFFIHIPLTASENRDCGELFKSGQLSESLVEMGQALLAGADNDKKRKAAVLAMYDILAFQGEYAAAGESLLHLGEAQAVDPMILCAKAKSLLHDSETDPGDVADEVKQILNQCKALDPGNPIYYAYSAELYIQLDEIDAAAREIAEGKQLSPGHEELVFIGSMLAVQENTGRGESESGLDFGIEEIEKALSVNPYRWESYELAGSFYFMSGNYERAVLIHNRLLKLRPWYFEEYLHFAEMLLRLPVAETVSEDSKRRLEQAVDLLGVYQRTGEDREYASSLTVSALAKLYYYHIKTAGDREAGSVILSQIRSYLKQIDERIGRNAEFLAYAGFELYVNRVPEIGEGMVAAALAIQSNLPYALQSYGVIIEDRAAASSDNHLKIEALQYFKRAVDSEKDSFTKGRYLLYLVDFLRGTQLEHLAGGHLRRGLEEELPVPELYDRMADEYIQNSRETEALEILEYGLSLFPGNEELTLRLGKEYIQNGNFEQGIRELTNLTELEERNAFYWNQLGISYIDWGNHIVKPEEANAVYSLGIDAFRRSIELMPSVSLFWGNCGDAYRMAGEYDDAAECLDKAASMAPEDPFNFHAMAKVFWEKGLSVEENERETFVRKSEYAFRKAQSLEPENPVYIRDMGDMYFYFGYFNEAADTYRKAVEFDPENSALYDAIGLSCYHLGEFSDAVEWFSTSLEYTDQKGEILNSLGLCHFEMGDFEIAQTFFQQASDSDPQNSVFLDNVFLTQYKILGIGDYPHGS